jgi:hypothetical protein
VHIKDRASSTHSTLFMAAIAASASVSEEKRTNPKPRLRPVSRSLTTTFCYVRYVMSKSGLRTASSTRPNSSNLVRKVVSSVCHARPLENG